VAEPSAAHLKAGPLFKDRGDRIANGNLVQAWMTELIARDVAAQVE